MKFHVTLLHNNILYILSNHSLPLWMIIIEGRTQIWLLSDSTSTQNNLPSFSLSRTIVDRWKAKDMFNIQADSWQTIYSGYQKTTTQDWTESRDNYPFCSGGPNKEFQLFLSMLWPQNCVNCFLSRWVEMDDKKELQVFRNFIIYTIKIKFWQWMSKCWLKKAIEHKLICVHVSSPEHYIYTHKKEKK